METPSSQLATIYASSDNKLRNILELNKNFSTFEQLLFGIFIFLPILSYIIYMIYHQHIYIYIYRDRQKRGLQISRICTFLPQLLETKKDVMVSQDFLTIGFESLLMIRSKGVDF